MAWALAYVLMTAACSPPSTISEALRGRPDQRR